MKNKGFVLMETIVVIVVISVALLTIFSSYNKILSKLRTENKYDTSEYIYMTYHIREYLKDRGVSANSIGGQVINYYNTSRFSNNIFNINKIYILTNFDSFSEPRNSEKFDAYMIDYIKKLDIKNTDKLIIVEYKRLARDNNYEPLHKYNTTCDENNSENKKNCLYETYIASLEWDYDAE